MNIYLINTGNEDSFKLGISEDVQSRLKSIRSELKTKGGFIEYEQEDKFAESKEQYLLDCVTF